MNKFMRNIMFSQLKSGILSDIKKHKPELLEKWGELLSIGFIVDKEKTMMRVKFKEYTGDSKLSEAEEQRFCKMVNLDIKKERANCLNIVANMFMDTKKIIIVKTFLDKPKETIII